MFPLGMLDLLAYKQSDQQRDTEYSGLQTRAWAHSWKKLKVKLYL